jgi:hypothetical protein
MIDMGLADPGVGLVESISSKSVTSAQGTQVADFERLLTQASDAHARVQLVNPLESASVPAVKQMTENLGVVSDRLTNSMRSVETSMKTFDVTDPAAFAKLLNNMSSMMVDTSMFQLAVGQVSSAQKSLSELFRNQG